MRDQHSNAHRVVTLVALSVLGEPLSLVISGTKLPTALTLCCLRVPGRALRWDVYADLTVVGSPSALAAYRRLVESRETRRKAFGKWAAPFRKPIRGEVVGGDVGERLESLGKAIGVTIEVAEGVSREPFHVPKGDLPADVVLDVVAVQLDADWRLDGDTIHLAPRDADAAK